MDATKQAPTTFNLANNNYNGHMAQCKDETFLSPIVAAAVMAALEKAAKGNPATGKAAKEWSGQVTLFGIRQEHVRDK